MPLQRQGSNHRPSLSPHKSTPWGGCWVSPGRSVAILTWNAASKAKKATAKRYTARQARPRGHFSQQIRSLPRPQWGRQHCGLQAAHPGESAAFQHVGVGRAGPSCRRWGWAGSGQDKCTPDSGPPTLYPDTWPLTLTPDPDSWTRLLTPYHSHILTGSIFLRNSYILHPFTFHKHFSFPLFCSVILNLVLRVQKILYTGCSRGMTIT